MANILRLSSLIPAGLVVEHAAEEEGMMVVSARSVAERRQCRKHAPKAALLGSISVSSFSYW